MKKMVLASLFLLVFSTVAMAAGTAITGSTTIGSLTYAPSNNVTISVDSNDHGYVAASFHGSGSRVFITDHLASKVYWQDATSATAATVFGSLQAPSAAGVRDFQPDAAALGVPTWTPL
jgi:hypothetical protein